MFHSNAGVPPPTGSTLVFQHIVNDIPHTSLEAWWKRHPHRPLYFEGTTDLHSRLPIPRVRTQEALLHTHLEVRIMSEDRSQCLMRFLCWYEHTTVFIATPNDVDRNIDDLGFDLCTTKRGLCSTLVGNPTLRLREVEGEYYACVGSKSIPLEYLY
jgi:hypothetical protein